MYLNELAWYFHHLHEANVRTEVRASIYPCNYTSFLPPLLLFSPSPFPSFLSFLPPDSQLLLF